MTSKAIFSSSASRALRAGLAALMAGGVLAAPLAAEAGSRRCWETDSGRVVCKQRTREDRRSADEREYDRARANDVDPGGSFAAYPDWARYALGQNKGRH